jgi:hypothetical protein
LSVAMIGNVYFRFIRPKLSTPEGVRTASAATSIPITIPRVTIEEPPIGNRVQEPPSPPAAGGVRDLFAPKASLQRPEPPKAAPSAPKPPPAFKLKGTIFGGEKAMALIDDQYVRTGERMGEFKVVRIGKKEVVIESEGRKITLEIMKNE